jgi:hypothetical protein
MLLKAVAEQAGLATAAQEPPMKPMRRVLIGAMLAAFSLVPAGAQPYDASGYPMGPTYDDRPFYGGRDPREGKVQASTFVASSPGVSALGHGTIVLSPGAVGAGGADIAAFESALVDQLTRAGYRTDAPPGPGGQIVEYMVRHDVIAPPEPRHSPVGGGVSVGVGNHGWSGVGLGIGIDLSKPRGPLIATRLEARIRDSATKELLWQGRAEVITRDGDKHWTPPATAERLWAALFKGFPKPISI